jgi:hypothetical protein
MMCSGLTVELKPPSSFYSYFLYRALFLLHSVKENVGSSESIMESFRLKGMQQKGGPSHYLLSVDTKTLGGRTYVH